MDTKLFKEYDIRGTYPDQINQDVAHRVGKALVQHFKPQQVAIGFDARTSGAELFRGLSEGILDMGVDVIDLGMITTDMAWFASGKFEFPLTVMISASHNPPEWNGFKMCTAGAHPVSLHTGLDKIQGILLSGNEPQAVDGQSKGNYSEKDIMEDWIKHALSFIKIENIKPLKVVVDASNGSGGEQTTEVFEHLSAELISQYFEPDGKFPNHIFLQPSKFPHHNTTLSEIINNDADVGFVFDPDADRIAVLDERGRTISGTVITALISEYLLEKNPGATILYNPTIGRIVPQTVEKLGGSSIRVKTGNMLIKQAMRDNEAIFAGETSYHFFFKDNYYADTGLITLLVLLEIISKKNKKVSEIVAEFDVYAQSGDINFKVEDKNAVLQSIKDGFNDADSKDELDGQTVWYKDWWFNVRASNTENLVRLNIEADNKEILEEKKKQMTEFIENLGGISA